MQLNWALLWQVGSVSTSTADGGSGSPTRSPDGSTPKAERPEQVVGDGAPSPLPDSGHAEDLQPRPAAPERHPGVGLPAAFSTHNPTSDELPSLNRRRIALHDLTPAAFEGLVRELFLAMGFTAWAENRASGDRGFDAVTINEDPVMGGSVLIQAKRIKRPVSVESLRSLAGAVDFERATKGFFVTTSHFTSAAYDFAARSGRIQLIDGRSLQSLLSQYLGIQADL
ncbi:restriction endonuclease [Streptomyces sp. Y2F8-2]|uniref:restriction endonuclease n=1 Tax=Streptomyces sp. Y2F8-2 TaxID=2759675 RepID=UPI0035B53AA0